jgi:hypothetical protein
MNGFENSTQDSALVRLVREGERAVNRIEQDTTLRRALGGSFLMLAALLFIPPWFLVPGLVFAGFSLLGFRPFRFGACGSKRRASTPRNGAAPESVKP